MDKLFSGNLCQFLVGAKKQTYASDNNDTAIAKPLLFGSTQLEWRSGDLLYRDVYFGVTFFVGLETVFENDVPKWAMSYSGGIIEGVGREEVGPTYAFLKLALAQVHEDKPFRGPEIFNANGFSYRMKNEGGVERFSGKEEIFFGDVLFYKLDFSGGWIS